MIKLLLFSLFLMTWCSESFSTEIFSDEKEEMLILDDDYNCFIISNDNQVIPCSPNEMDKLIRETKFGIDTEGICVISTDEGILPCTKEQEQEFYTLFLEKLSKKSGFSYNSSKEVLVDTIKNSLVIASGLVIIASGLVVITSGAILITSGAILITPGVTTLFIALGALTATGLSIMNIYNMYSLTKKNIETDISRNVGKTLCTIYRNARIILALNNVFREDESCEIRITFENIL